MIALWLTDLKKLSSSTFSHFHVEERKGKYKSDYLMWQIRYVDFWQTKENGALSQEQNLCCTFTRFFFEQKQSENTSEKLFFFIEKNLQRWNGKPQKKKKERFFKLRLKKPTNIQSVTATCIRV